jgi:CheY-like chemotaxis protein
MSPHKVLVVDDSPSFRALAIRILTEWGYEVAEASTVSQALDRAYELRPSAVLADIGLPDGDGFALTQLLLDLPWPIRVILISSDSDAGNSFEAQRLGAFGFVPKDDLMSDEFRELLGQD